MNAKTYSAVKTDRDHSRNHIVVDEAGTPVAWEGEVIYALGADAIEIAAGLTAGKGLDSFGYGIDYEVEADPYAYGGEMHQAFGDSFLYADCPGAW